MILKNLLSPSFLPSLRGTVATWQSIPRNSNRLLRFARNNQTREAGNALWFILIAILLLGLLTSMITRSGSSTNDTGDYEQLTIQANEILNYAKSIENGVQSLLARGCSENEISFEANNNSGYANPNSPSDNFCHVFEPEGAGLTYIAPNEKWLDASQNAKSGFSEYTFNSANGVTNIGEDSKRDLIFIFPYIKKELCIQLNSVFEITTISNEPPSDNDIKTGIDHGFKGDLSGSVGFSTRIEGALNGSVLAGKNTGCFLETTGCYASSCYIFYNVLLAR